MTLADLDAAEVQRAADGGPAKREYVRRIFSEIAPRYDLLNHLLSFNIDRRWRARALAQLGWQRAPSGTYLDLCAGTMDVAAQLVATPGFDGSVIAADFAEPMLRAGRGKGRPGRMAPVVGDALALPLADRSVDGAIVAFGIRNLASLEDGLREVYRVLKPGARLVVLEFSTPRSPLVRGGYRLYFHHVLPIVGGVVSGHATAYRYLPESVKRFPVQHALASLLSAVGFARVTWRDVTFGIAAIHVGSRP
jgi:demethylmenaquinone methyltransferase/2-methoxy-6-polyprenyl-1,4-benzoquinol methylase